MKYVIDILQHNWLSVRGGRGAYMSGNGVPGAEHMRIAPPHIEALTIPNHTIP